MQREINGKMKVFRRIAALESRRFRIKNCVVKIPQNTARFIVIDESSAFISRIL